MRGFLYGQTEYNLLKTAVKIEEYVELAKNLKFDYLSITDSNLYGFYKFYNRCLEANIKPIIGLELLLNNNLDTDLFLLYPLNNEGLKALFQIETAKNNNELNIELLQSLARDIAFISVVSKSFLVRSLVSLPDEAISKLNYYKDKFPNFYLGISYQVKSYNKINLDALAIARNIGVLSVYIHQLKYLTKEDEIVYKTLLKIGNNEEKEEGDFSFFQPEQNFIDEWIELFINTDNLVNRIKYQINKEKALPKYPLDNSEQFLITLANKGLVKRLANKNVNLKKYQERLNYELNIINKMHFADYFLIVWDFIKWAKKQNIYVGPGRGSAASSLVAYAIGITEICPLDYNLLFERFLNPERISMPDIDTDFPDNKRDDVIAYVADLYGKYHVASINTFGTFSYKSSLRDVARVYKIEEKRIKELSNMLADNKIDDLVKTYKYQEDIYNLLYVIKRLDGMPRNISTHAAGVIISGPDLRNIVPLNKVNNLLQTELEYDDLKNLGLLKMDFLGIRNLTIIANVLDEIKMKQIDFRNIPLDDKMVYTLLQKADTLGVFQLESSGIRRVLTKLKPTKFTDLVAVLALYRPGPMDNIDEFIARRHGKKFTYLHKDLEPILAETYGIIVYQEQIMQIAYKFANYSLGKADILRRAISNKDIDQMEHLRKDFVGGCQKNKYDINLANTIFDLIVKFANYGFNKAHSVAYALVCYEMAYLKVHYFGNFMSNILNNVIGATNTMQDYLKYAKRHNLAICGVDINVSTNKFRFKNNKLYLPLVCIDQIGQQTADTIIKERKNGLFKSYNDFLSRVNISEAQVANLVYAGAFNLFNPNIKNLIEHNSKEANLIDTLLGDDLKVNEDDYSLPYLISMEKKVLGFNITYDPSIEIKPYRLNNNATSLNHITLNKKEVAVIKFTNLDLKNSKNGYMLKGEIYDDTTTLPFVIFNNLYLETKDIINENDIYLIGFVYKKHNDFEPSCNIGFIKKIN